MSSLIPGYEYDLFISYRHKDNRYDGWVSEFVANLKRELEATFKDEISVYIDENPHDGLLESHNVDKSLEGKLKCLIFIPIVSQTYCDTRSFAWQHELRAFNKMAKEDSFGRDIKLTNGNVASRILPIKIHDLDAEDKSLLESELGEVLRCIEFIYKSAGVNRPLKPNDERAANSNHTYYRDQINKVANALKGIVQGMLAREKPPTSRPGSASEIYSQPKKFNIRKLRAGVLAILIMALALIGYYGFTDWLRGREVTAIRNSSIAILPFENQTGRPELTSIGQVAADFISTELIQHKFWKVIPTQDIFRQTVYSGVVTNSEAEKRIIEHGNVDFLVIGHYNLIGDSVLLVVSVNDVAENNVRYTTPVIKCSSLNPMKAVTEAQQFILGYLMFSTAEKEASSRPPKYNAYQEYLKGMELLTKSNLAPGNTLVRLGFDVESHFKKSIALDENFLPPYFKLAELYNSDRRYAGLDSTIQVLETKQNLFSERDKLNYDIQKLTSKRDWNSLEKLLLSKVESSSSEFRPYFQLAIVALVKQNRPRHALEYLDHCDMSQFDFVNKPSDWTFYIIKAQAFLRLRRFEEVISLTDTLEYARTSYPLAQRLYALYYLNRKDEASKDLETFLNIANPSTDPGVPSMALFRTAQLKGDSTYMLKQYKRYEEYMALWDTQTLQHSLAPFVHAVMRFRMKDNIDEAEKQLKSDLPVVSRQRRIHQLGILYAVTGREAEARRVIQDMLSHESKYDNGITRYYVAKIESELGNKDKAVAYLQESMAKGMEYGEALFEYDGDLKNLIDYPPFIELITPKE